MHWIWKLLIAWGGLVFLLLLGWISIKKAKVRKEAMRQPKMDDEVLAIDFGYRGPCVMFTGVVRDGKLHVTEVDEIETEAEQRSDPENHCLSCGDYSEMLDGGQCPVCFEIFGYVGYRRYTSEIGVVQEPKNPEIRTCDFDE